MRRLNLASLSGFILVFAFSGCHLFRGGVDGAGDSVAVDLAPDEPADASTDGEIAPTRPADPPVEVTPPRIVIPGGRWVLQESDHLTLTPSPGTKSVSLEIALDPNYQIVLASAVEIPVSEDSPTAPLDVRIEAHLKPGDDIHVRACAVKAADDSRTPWRRARFRVWLARPRIVAEKSSFEIDATQSPEFAWSAVRGASGYEVEVFREQTFEESEGAAPRLAMSVSQGTLTHARSGEPLEPGSYTMRVQALAENAEGDWSEPHVFRVIRPVPRVVAPTNYQIVTERRPLVEWTAQALAETIGFEIELVRLAVEDGAAADPLVYSTDAPTETTLRVPQPLERGSRYTTRVREVLRADVGTTRGAWSDAVVFEIVSAPIDPFPVRQLLARDDAALRRPVVSRDGQVLACLAFDLTGDESSSRVELFQRETTDGRTSFVPLADATARFPGLDGIRLRARGLAWSESEDGARVLLVCGDDCSRDETRGALYVLREHADRISNLDAALFDDAPRKPSAPAVLVDGCRISVEFTGPPCSGPLALSSPLPAAEVWSMRTDGDDGELVGLGSSPALSPDGLDLAFVAHTRDGLEIRLERLSPSVATDPSSGAVIVPAADPGAMLRDLAWSPDGKRLAFSKHVGAHSTLVLADATTSEEVQLTDAFAEDEAPCFLPALIDPTAAAEIVFESDRAGDAHEIWIVDLRTGD